MNRMARNVIIAAAACIALAVAAWFLLKPSSPELETDSGAKLLADKNWQEVSEVEIINDSSTYTVKKQPDGTYRVHDIPEFAVNMDYVAMLLDECSQIAYEEVVEEGTEHLETYGLNSPASTVQVTYQDNSSVRMFIGMEEPVSKGRYAMMEGSGKIVLLKGSRCIRFLMPVERYIDYIIIAPNESTDILRALGDVTFGGSQFPEQVVLKEVTAESGEEILRQAASFGAVTHIITEPVVHEADPAGLTAAADSLMGLLSEGVVAYNCTGETLAEYGFDDPVLTVEFDYKNEQEAGPEHIVLKMSRLEDGTNIVTRNEEGIIYKIADVAFTELTYDSLVLRWFLTPLLAEVKTLEIETGGELYRMETTGEKPKELTVSMEGRELNPDLYRKFYNLVVSAASDGGILEDKPKLSGEPVMQIRFIYEDRLKPEDVLKLYEGPLRRHYVEVNGVCEYTMREKYMSCVQDALAALTEEREFSQDW